MTASPIAPGSARAWLLATRPQTLTAAVVPVAVGTACAAAVGGFAPAPALAALVCAMLIQVGTNLANDLFDFESGADDDNRLGPTRAAQAGLLSPRALRRGTIATFAAATAVGGYLVYVGGWPVVAMGAASIASGVAYTGGPYPLGYHGLGDVFVMIFFGFVAVCGTAYVQVGSVPELAWWCSLPVGAIATAVLVVNNLRDRDTDRGAGKRTLAVRFGAAGARAEYVALMALAYATPAALVVSGLAGPLALLPLLSLPVAVILSRAVLARDGAALNPLLARTAQLLALYGGLLAAGLAL